MKGRKHKKTWACVKPDGDGCDGNHEKEDTELGLPAPMAGKYVQFVLQVIKCPQCEGSMFDAVENDNYGALFPRRMGAQIDDQMKLQKIVFRSNRRTGTGHYLCTRCAPAPTCSKCGA